MEKISPFNVISIKVQIQKEGQADILIDFRDIQLHQHRRNTKSLLNLVRYSEKTNKPSRFYFESDSIIKLDEIGKRAIVNPMIIINNPQIIELTKEGYAISFILPPEEDFDLFFGKEVQEFLNGIKGKRILRKIIKDRT